MAKLYNANVTHICDSSNGIMSLYSAGRKGCEGKKPIVFIRGHAGRFTVNTKKFLDNTPNNYKLLREHEGFWYSDEDHYAYIVDYAYKDNMKRKKIAYDTSQITTATFADSTIELFKMAELNDVDMVGASVGGTVSVLCSKSDLVDRVSVVSPVLPYSPLADISLLSSVKNDGLMNYILYMISRLYLNQDFGFVQDMDKAYRDPLVLKSMIDAEKIFINAGDVGNLYRRRQFNKTGDERFEQYKRIHDFFDSLLNKGVVPAGIILSADAITNLTGFPSDGAIVTDTDYYDELGVQYEVSDDAFHADCDRSEILLKRAYNNLQKVKKI